MISNRHWLSVLLVSLLPGCAGWTTPWAEVPNVRPARLQRARDTAATIDKERDTIELQAARCDLDQGNVGGCRALLERILERNPNQPEAQQLMAKVASLERKPVQREMQTSADASADRENPSENPVKQVSFQDELNSAARPDLDWESGDSNPPEPPMNDGEGEPRWFEEGQAALSAGDLSHAEDCFSSAVENAPGDASLAHRAALAALRHDAADLAVHLSQQGLRDSPDCVGLYQLLGAAQYRRGEWEDSAEALRKALSLDNSNPLSYSLLGCTLTRLGQTEDAQAHFREARQLDPRYELP